MNEVELNLEMTMIFTT